MAPVVRTNTLEEVHTIGISSITFVQRTKGVKVYQNDELITVLSAPIMKIVRAFRKHYGKNVELTVV
jgi:hypothetical protein